MAMFARNKRINAARVDLMSKWLKLLRRYNDGMMIVRMWLDKYGSESLPEERQYPRNWFLSQDIGRKRLLRLGKTLTITGWDVSS